MMTKSALLIETAGRQLHVWSPEGVRHSYPVLIASRDDLPRWGATIVARKVEGPVWRPTAQMLRRDALLPEMIAAGPENPFGSHALILGWDHVRLHGLPEPRWIDPMGELGSIGMSNEHIAEVFGLVGVGTPVRLV